MAASSKAEQLTAIYPSDAAGISATRLETAQNRRGVVLCICRFIFVMKLTGLSISAHSGPNEMHRLLASILSQDQTLSVNGHTWDWLRSAAQGTTGKGRAVAVASSGCAASSAAPGAGPPPPERPASSGAAAASSSTDQSPAAERRQSHFASPLFSSVAWIR